MAAQSYEPTPEELSLLDTVIRAVARARRLACGDFQDFAQTVHLKLLERRYDAFSRFRGDSSLRTYLTVVVTRILLDWRNARYGKWRPSAAAGSAAAPLGATPSYCYARAWPAHSSSCHEKPGYDTIAFAIAVFTIAARSSDRA